MIGETVTVEFPKASETVTHDPFGAEVAVMDTVDVPNVLVEPGELRDDTSSTRPDGTEVRYRLHFPKGFDTDLEGLRVQVRGEWYRVIGRPDHYTLEDCPTEWWMPVSVGVIHG